MDPIATARYGMMAAAMRLEASAARVAQADGGANDVDLGVEVVEQIGAKQMFSANVGVLRAGEDMWRALLKIQEAR